MAKHRDGSANFQKWLAASPTFGQQQTLELIYD